MTGPPDSGHRNRLVHPSEPSAGDHHPVDCAQDSPGTPLPANLFATLIEQLQENWDHDNNAANDELVMRIREHIRRQQATASAQSVGPDGEAEDTQRPLGAGATSSPPLVDFPHRMR